MASPRNEVTDSIGSTALLKAQLDMIEQEISELKEKKQQLKQKKEATSKAYRLQLEKDNQKKQQEAADKKEERLRAAWHHAAEKGDIDTLEKLFKEAIALRMLTFKDKKIETDDYSLLATVKYYAFEKEYIHVLERLSSLANDYSWLNNYVVLSHPRQRDEMYALQAPGRFESNSFYDALKDPSNVIFPLIYACVNQKKLLATFLVQHIADVNQTYCDALQPQYFKGKVFYAVKPHGSVLSCAIQYKMRDVALTLIDKGANIHVKHSDTRSHWSTADGRTEWDSCNLTPLVLAAKYNEFEIFKLLLDKGANIEDGDDKNAFQITTSSDIRKLYLMRALPSQCLKSIKFQGTIPEHLAYYRSIMDFPVLNPLTGKTCCKIAYIRRCHDSKSQPLHMKDYLAVMNAPKIESLAEEIQTFVNVQVENYLNNDNTLKHYL